MSGGSGPYGAAVRAGLDHLAVLVQQHEASHGVPEAPADISASWEPSGWWLSIVMPGHYAFEVEDRDDLAEIVTEAVAYYGGTVPLWPSDGCREHHPLPSDPEQAR